jgi:hypothetical protein
VAPLVPADPEKLEAIERRKQPQFAFVPGVAKLGLVADLDRTMSVEKEVVARWTRTPGLSSRLEIRRFAEALERKRGRFAFPDDFHGFVKKLRSRILRKFGTNGDEGHGLDLLDEIRVRAAPSWNAAAVTLDFLFIRAPEDEGLPTADWPELLKGWMKLVPPGGRYGIVEGQVTTLDRLSAADYVGSERLDLDDVSPPREIAPSP